MAGESRKRNRQREAPVVVELPKPSITLDIVTPRPGGGVSQTRPTFNDFGEAMDELNAAKHSWAKTLEQHKKAARAKKRG